MPLKAVLFLTPGAPVRGGTGKRPRRCRFLKHMMVFLQFLMTIRPFAFVDSNASFPFCAATILSVQNTTYAALYRNQLGDYEPPTSGGKSLLFNNTRRSFEEYSLGLHFSSFSLSQCTSILSHTSPAGTPAPAIFLFAPISFTFHRPNSSDGHSPTRRLSPNHLFFCCGRRFSGWEETDSVGNVYNRVILFRAKYFHRSAPYFGSVDEDLRLFQVLFWSSMK